MNQTLLSMTELMEAVVKLTKKVDELTLLVMKEKNDTTWISEKDAADMLGYGCPRTLRKKVKAAVYPFNTIVYRSSEGRKFQYNRKSLQKFKEQTAVA